MTDAPRKNVQLSGETSPELTTVLKRFTLLVMALMTLMAIGAFGLSVWYFIGFTENDGGVGHLLSAALVCFGTGALFYLPAYWIARRAYRTVKERRTKHMIILPAFLGFPWLIFGFFLQGMNGWWAYAGWFVSGMGALSIAWVWALSRRS